MITKDLEEKLEGISTTRELIIEKGKEITKDLIKLYELLKEYTQKSGGNLEIKEFTTGNYKMAIFQKGGSLYVNVGDESYIGNLYTLMVEPSKKGLNILLGTGDADRNWFSSHKNFFREPHIPKGRSLPVRDTNLGDYKKKLYTTSNDFFLQLAKNYPAHAQRITQILEALTNLPLHINQQLKNPKKAIMKTIAEENKGIKKLEEINFSEENQVLLKLYDVKSEMFKICFNSLPEEKQKMVCESLLTKKNSNKELDAWLGQTYPSLIEYVGRDRIEQRMEEDKRK